MSVLFEQKNKKLWNKRAQKTNRDFAACLKKEVNFLVDYTYKIFFSECFPTCVCVCECRSL